MSKYGTRAGHSLDVQGASGYVNEVSVARLAVIKLNEYLIQLRNEVLDVTPTYSGTSYNDLNAPMIRAVNWGAEFYVSIHLNASNGEGHGCEVIYKTEAERVIAERVASKLASLGFANRGAKPDTRGLFEFNHTSMTNVIVELFFCDSADDVELYMSIGMDAIAKVVAEGLTNQSVTVTNGWILENNKWFYYVNGQLIKNGWVQWKDRWFCFNENGEMINNGWFKWKNKWYYMDNEGAMVTSIWIFYEGKQYYLGSDGVMATDTIIDGWKVDQEGAWDGKAQIKI